MYKKYSDQFLAQQEKIVVCQIAIEDIYTKHKATTQFEPINKDIEKYLKDKQNELNVFAARVDNRAAGVLPTSEQASKAKLLTAMSHEELLSTIFLLNHYQVFFSMSILRSEICNKCPVNNLL